MTTNGHQLAMLEHVLISEIFDFWIFCQIKYVLRVFFFDPCIHQWNIKSWIEILQRNKLENDEQPQQINSNPLQGILSVSWLGFFFKTSLPLWQSVSSFIRWTCKICHRGKCPLESCLAFHWLWVGSFIRFILPLIKEPCQILS